MNVAVITPVGQLVDQRMIAMESEDDGLILGKQRIVFRIRQTMRMHEIGLQLHKVNHVDYADLKFRQSISQNGHSSQCL